MDATYEWRLDKEKTMTTMTLLMRPANDRPSSAKYPLLSPTQWTRVIPRPIATVDSHPRSLVAAISGSGRTEFPGAKGLQVPASLRDVLRPHQREGIVYLWNCVTGANEKELRRVFDRRRNDEEHGLD